MISVICCFSDKNKLETMLVKSLQNQQADFEQILIDNTDRKFSSAAAALNHGFELSKGEYVVFIHQDVQFDDINFLDNIKCQINDLGENVIVGAAGIKGENQIYTNLVQGPNRSLAGQFTMESPEKVQTLDEVMIATTRDIFQKIKFDAITCDNWHLYGADLCLTASEMNIDSYAIPTALYHLSLGNVDSGYMKTLEKVVKKHKKNFDIIYTTNSRVDVKKFNSFIYNTKHLIRVRLIPIIKSNGLGKKIFQVLGKD